MNAERIILGIDPGNTYMGYGVLRVVKQHVEFVALGVVDLHKIKSHFLSLKTVFQKVTLIIEQYLPDEMAIEAPFFGKNVQSMLKLGRAQGVAITAAISRDIPVVEYAPLKIKQAITGNGRAAKEQVAQMLCHLLKIDANKLPKQLDATDGLAVAYCHYMESGKPTVQKKYSSWKDFAAKNSGKIR